MAELIIGIVQDILGHVAIKNRESSRVERVPSSGSSSSSGNFELCLPGSSEFPVLFPQIALEDFGRGQEAQDGGIASCKPAASIAVWQSGLGFCRQ